MIINEFFTTIFIDLLTFLLSFVVLVISIKTIRFWDTNSTSQYQYTLEKQIYLANILIIFITILKTINLPFLLFYLDKISPLISGAMCAAGVININSFGDIFLYFKIIVLLLIAIWVLLHHIDINNRQTPYTKQKSYLFIVIFLSIFIETILNILYFTNINTNEIVKCCSQIYNDIDKSNILLSGTNIVIFSITITLINISAILLKNNKLLLISTPIFFMTILLLITYKISPYIYELPTHQCPYCLLQKEYNYIGYFIYFLLFVSTFLQMTISVLNIWLNITFNKLYRWAFLATLTTICLLAYYPASYYITNGVFCEQKNSYYSWYCYTIVTNIYIYYIKR